jgi:hypothetical protein
VKWLNSICNSIFKNLKIIPYLMFIQYTNFNIQATKNCNTNFCIIALVNIGFSLGQLILIKYSSISYRFEDKDYLKRKSFSLIPWLMALLILFSLTYLSLLTSCFFMAFRAVLQIYFNFFKL